MAKPSFRDQFSKAQIKAMRAAAAVAKQRTYGFMAAVIDDTPVKVGALRGGWQIVKASGDLNPHTPIDPTGSLTKAILNGKIRVLPITMDWDIYFGNGKPYASRIEYEGYSKQAPNGMLRKNLAKGGTAFSGFKLGSFE